VKHRLYLPRLAETNPVSGTLFELAPEQAHYLSRLLRLKPDSDLAVFDGQGREWLARVTEATPKAALITIIELRCEEPPPTPLILVQSWLKGAAMDRVVQKATELGVTAVWLLSARRSNVKLDERRMASKLSHLVRVAASAAEQCETLWLPAFDRYEDLSAVLNARGSLQTLMLDLDAVTLDAGPRPVPTLLLVGPEGGWAEEERALATAQGIEQAGLGKLVLRAETAPLAALSAIRHGWGWER
jgi:16S rRNA (uracil1498-N3)-methyltransferase